MTYTVILVAGQQTQPLRTIEADTTEDAWEKARELFPATDLAIVQLLKSQSETCL